MMLTNLPETLPARKRVTIHQLVDALAQTSGVVAVVLGGSSTPPRWASSSLRLGTMRIRWHTRWRRSKPSGGVSSS
jgi:hypothetical protein